MSEAERIELREERDRLLAVEYMTETNEGTYGAVEAGRKCGTGDPRFANRYVYETVGGTRREQGMDADRYPGRMRHLDTFGLARDRARVKEIERLLGLR